MSLLTRLYGLLATSLCVAPAIAGAQTIGGAVPPYEPPPQYQAPQAPQAGSTITPFPSAPVQRENAFAAREQVVRDFSAAYQKAKKPKIAIFWNRELTDTLDEWYGTSRVVITQQGQGSLSGNYGSNNLNLSGQGNSQTSIEQQKRTGSDQRAQFSETREWQFQDGFLGPFLKAGAYVVDRAAIVRLTGVNAGGMNGKAIETQALSGMADILIEVLAGNTSQSRSGYELRARVLETKTGRILGYVNSRGLKEWNEKQEAIATNRGFILPDDDEDDESFGPNSGPEKYRATSQGFKATRKPPKLDVVAQNLAYNVMDSLMGQWR
jgi:hypothetical protein